MLEWVDELDGVAVIGLVDKLVMVDKLAATGG